MKQLLFVILLLLFYGCSDNATITHYKKDIKEIPCLKLEAKQPLLQKSLTKLYRFQKNCNYLLRADYKSAIVCNSNQNANLKIKSNFPNRYLRLDIYSKDRGLIISYYLDSNEEITQKTIQDAFEKLSQAITIKGAK